MKSLIAALLCLAVTGARADAVDALREFVRDAKSGHATFTQVVTSPDGAKKKTSSGSFDFARPNRFRFVYTKPLEQLIVGDGPKVWVYDADHRTVLGPYGAADVRDHGELWSVPIEGDTMLVELYWPAKLRGEQPRVHLGTVSHGYKPFGSIGASEENSLLGGSGACNIDVACPLGDDWQDQQRGVVILLSSGGSSFCTGSLINNTANDCKPYVLTAAHCSPGASTAYGFNFQRSACGSGNPPGPTTQMVSGGTV